ncbi:hypothetical protein N7451_012869 [Penicillium sp. IBT 35674x]|nr:hypothetical protein N7451_012869 [Penicillium sp. IBT 35674x]
MRRRRGIRGRLVPDAGYESLLRTIVELTVLVGASIPQKQLMPNPGHCAKGLSQTEFPPKKPTIESRRIAIIIGDGYDRIAFEGMKTAIKAAGALPFVIGTKRSPVYAEGQSSESSGGVVAELYRSSPNSMGT